MLRHYLEISSVVANLRTTTSRTRPRGFREQARCRGNTSRNRRIVNRAFQRSAHLHHPSRGRFPSPRHGRTSSTVGPQSHRGCDREICDQYARPGLHLLYQRSAPLPGPSVTEWCRLTLGVCRAWHGSTVAVSCPGCSYALTPVR